MRAIEALNSAINHVRALEAAHEEAHREGDAVTQHQIMLALHETNNSLFAAVDAVAAERAPQ